MLPRSHTHLLVSQSLTRGRHPGTRRRPRSRRTGTVARTGPRLASLARSPATRLPLADTESPPTHTHTLPYPSFPILSRRKLTTPRTARGLPELNEAERNSNPVPSARERRPPNYQSRKPPRLAAPAVPCPLRSPSWGGARGPLGNVVPRPMGAVPGAPRFRGGGGGEVAGRPVPPTRQGKRFGFPQREGTFEDEWTSRSAALPFTWRLRCGRAPKDPTSKFPASLRSTWRPRLTCTQ